MVSLGVKLVIISAIVISVFLFGALFGSTFLF
jgi:hypothetical protein